MTSARLSFRKSAGKNTTPNSRRTPSQVHAEPSISAEVAQPATSFDEIREMKEQKAERDQVDTLESREETMIAAQEDQDLTQELFTTGLKPEEDYDLFLVEVQDELLQDAKGNSSKTTSSKAKEGAAALSLIHI